MHEMHFNFSRRLYLDLVNHCQHQKCPQRCLDCSVCWYALASLWGEGRVNLLVFCQSHPGLVDLHPNQN